MSIIDTLRIEGQTAADVLDTLERTECVFWACDGPTLEPVDMVTCYRCATLAQVRHAFGLVPREPDEMTCSEAIDERDRRHAERATHRTIAPRSAAAATRPLPPWRERLPGATPGVATIDTEVG